MVQSSDPSSQSTGIKAELIDTSPQVSNYFVLIIGYNKQLQDSRRNHILVKASIKRKRQTNQHQVAH